MNDKRVLELWVEAARDPRIIYNFAELVAAETREECAKICDELGAESEYAAVLIRRMS